MRSLNYVQRISLDFTGTLFPHAICLGDADNDSLNELIVGDTSGKLYVYKNDDSKPWVTRTCVGMLTCVAVGDVCNKGKNFVVAVGAEGWFHLFDLTAAAPNKADSSSQHLVSRPGWGSAILLCSWTQQDSPGSGDDSPTTTGSEGPSRDIILHLTTGRIHNKNVSTHLIGSINKGSKEESSKCGLFALCTLDGTLKLMDSSEQLLWSVQVDHQLFALQKLDVTGDGREEVVACAWDGQTYIIDHNRSVVRFQFDENVNAFCAGQYTCKEGKNSPCLVYVSFNHKIYIYWKVELERMESTNLLRLLEEKPGFKDQVKALGVDADDPAAVRALVADILYTDSRT
ncbi:KICSTOR complex protein ITFG2 [Cynoglossus semilaevis]|uniref:KICSTOR complex protein ITFG2 n=1 Tax=Cynoglossus semilaevis TaxID=244447 RepID=UPI000495CBE7|nr:KICSTOR complex protein ITFG2 [Cynoglossus semilaevis]